MSLPPHRGGRWRGEAVTDEGGVADEVSPFILRTLIRPLRGHLPP